MFRWIPDQSLLVFCLLFLLILCGNLNVSAQTELPRPILVFKKKEPLKMPYGEAVLYRLDVENKTDFPAEMFAPAPDLPACGKNTNSSRSWIDIYAQKSGRIYSFCSLKSATELDQLAFILPKDRVIDYVYIVINDRLKDRSYKSTLVSTQIE